MTTRYLIAVHPRDANGYARHRLHGLLPGALGQGVHLSDEITNSSWTYNTLDFAKVDTAWDPDWPGSVSPGDRWHYARGGGMEFHEIRREHLVPIEAWIDDWDPNWPPDHTNPPPPTPGKNGVNWLAREFMYLMQPNEWSISSWSRFGPGHFTDWQTRSVNGWPVVTIATHSAVLGYRYTGREPELQRLYVEGCTVVWNTMQDAAVEALAETSRDALTAMAGYRASTWTDARDPAPSSFLLRAEEYRTAAFAYLKAAMEATVTWLEANLP